jgi:hypothetical protein
MTTKIYDVIVVGAPCAPDPPTDEPQPNDPGRPRPADVRVHHPARRPPARRKNSAASWPGTGPGW